MLGCPYVTITTNGDDVIKKKITVDIELFVAMLLVRQIKDYSV